MRQIVALVAVLAVAACGGPATPSSALPSVAQSVKPSETTKPSSAPTRAVPSPVVVNAGEAWIVAQPHSQHLVLLRPDGSSRGEILTQLPFEQFHPDWAPYGEQLVFEHAPRGPDADIRDIWISGADGSNPEPLLTADPAGLEGMFWSNPAWSPDGRSIAMIGYQGNASMVLPTRSVLAIVDVATRELSVVSEYESGDNGNLHSNPRWSNDGRAFVLTLDHFEGEDYVGGAIAVITQGAGGWTEPKLVTRPEDWADHADWHPTQDLIVFCTYEYGAFFSTDEPSNLYTIRADGSNRVQLTDFGPGEERATQPTWTHDGRIIFTYSPGNDSTGEDEEPERPAFLSADGSGLEIVDVRDLVYPRLRPPGG